MNSFTSAHVYFLFALALLLIGWKMSHAAETQMKAAQAQSQAQIERYLSDSE